MSRAEDLFKRLTDGQLTSLDQLLADFEPESLFVDFKRAHHDGTGVRLEESDEKNLSKGISGFANSEGGLLIWGVDCRLNRVTGHEEANKHPLLDAHGFRTRLEAAVSRQTVPQHPGVQMLTIVDADEARSGFVVVLVPKSPFEPLRSNKTNHYHFRSGSNFEIVPHSVLAGMFGRTPQPNISFNLVSHPARMSERRDALVLAFGAVAINLGGVLAEKVYLSIWYGDFPSQNLHANASNPQSYPLQRGRMFGFSVVGNDGISLAPGATQELCDIVLQVSQGYGRPIQLKCTLGARGAAPTHFTIDVPVENIENAIARALQGEVLRTSDFFVTDPSMN